MAKKKEVENEPNVMFIGGSKDMSAKGAKEGEEGFVAREPIAGFRDGMKQYKLPSLEEQLAGPFYFADARILTRLYKKLYKAYVEKGAK